MVPDFRHLYCCPYLTTCFCLFICPCNGGSRRMLWRAWENDLHMHPNRYFTQCIFDGIFCGLGRFQQSQHTLPPLLFLEHDLVYKHPGVVSASHPEKSAVTVVMEVMLIASAGVYLDTSGNSRCSMNPNDTVTSHDCNSRPLDEGRFGSIAPEAGKEYRCTEVFGDCNLLTETQLLEKSAMEAKLQRGPVDKYTAVCDMCSRGTLILQQSTARLCASPHNFTINC